MIIDTSVLVALLRKEEDADRFIRALSTSEPILMSAGSWVELAAVTTRSAIDDGVIQSRQLADQIGIEIVPVTIEQAEIACDAYRTYGRGAKSEPNLNFGDCFAYALAKATSQTLLFKGDDFTCTDVRRALP